MYYGNSLSPQSNPTNPPHPNSYHSMNPSISPQTSTPKNNQGNENEINKIPACEFMCDGMLRKSAAFECRRRITTAKCLHKNEFDKCMSACEQTQRTSDEECKARCTEVYVVPCADDFMTKCTDTATKWGKQMCNDTCGNRLGRSCEHAIKLAMEASKSQTLSCDNVCSQSSPEHHGTIDILARLLIGHDLSIPNEFISEIILHNCHENCKKSQSKNLHHDIHNFCSHVIKSDEPFPEPSMDKMLQASQITKNKDIDLSIYDVNIRPNEYSVRSAETTIHELPLSFSW